MTSSLVGSEMCIRDRSRSRLAALATFICWGWHLLQCLLKTPQENPLYWLCLLYTSDAADDM
eukprot:4517058-Prorocentrum_lima.AAC.1